MSTEQHIDTGVIDAALDAWFAERGIRAGVKGDAERDAMKIALNAAEEKRRELAQADPEGQEYAYRVAWSGGIEGIRRTKVMSLVKAEQFKDEMEGTVWVERALLGTWEKLD